MNMVRKKSHKKWYMLVYDVREPKRLQKIHYFMKKHGIAMQKSVFILKIDNTGLYKVISGVKELVNNREDDVRIYPITTPSSIWAAGQQDKKLENLFVGTPKHGNSIWPRFIAKFFNRKRV